MKKQTINYINLQSKLKKAKKGNYLNRFYYTQYINNPLNKDFKKKVIGG